MYSLLSLKIKYKLNEKNERVKSSKSTNTTLLENLDKKKDSIKIESFKKSGNDLLSRNTSTISANGLNFSVRNGKR